MKYKKVGLITFYESDNFGTCLQAYALCNAINNLGYTCEIICFNRYENSPVRNNSKLETIKILGVKKIIDILLSKRIIENQKEKFRLFRAAYMHLSEQEYSSIRELEKTSKDYEAFIVGSDMVWSWESRPFLDIYFLKFAPMGKRIAYAPSFGNTEFNEKMNEYYMQAIAGIDFISCRDRKGAEYIRNILGKKCELVLDPTFLLEGDEWKKTFFLKKKKSLKRTVLIYMFGKIPPNTFKEIKKKVKGKWEIRFIPEGFRQYCCEKKHGNAVFGPIDFLESYYNADMIITNTFHGLVFAMIFEKPFVLFHREGKEHWHQHEERMTSLLEQMGLSDRYLEVGDELKKEFFELDYTELKKKLEDMKSESMEYLKRSVCSVVKG